VHATVSPNTLKCAETCIDRTDHFSGSPAHLLLLLLSQVSFDEFVGVLCSHS